MYLRMITDAELQELSVPEKLFAYAGVYLGASRSLCEKMEVGAASNTWPNAAVVLMLAAHAVELFLKGAILSKNPNANVWAFGHYLDKLAADYRLHFPEPELEWDIPFQAEFPEGLAEAEIEALKAQMPPPSILYRYPVEKGGSEWRGIYGFEPVSFDVVLADVQKAFEHIKSRLA
jgi:hypothetical protein